MYVWSPESIRFRIDAAEYTHYDDVIAAQILPQIPPDAHVCDAGCGLGYLSLALAKGCARVTAVDTSAAALAVLTDAVARQGVRNIEAREDDLFSMRPETPYDAMVFCFFGGLEETLRAAKLQCRGTIFLIKKNWKTHRFTPGQTPLRKFTYRQTLQKLDALGVPCKTDTFSIEMGQPFRSLEDAARFFETYRREEDRADVDLKQLERSLSKTESAEFPHFLPADRSLGWISVDVRDIPERLPQ